MTEKNRKLPFARAILIIILFAFSIVVFDQYMSDQRVRQFASETAAILYKRICSSEQLLSRPCGTLDVRHEADSGLIVYLYVFGITEPREINDLSEVIKTLRRNKTFYRKVPVKVIFYADLQRSSVVKQFWILGE
ncbi:MAG: hypothetical protein WCL27_15135 [Betaproteobacteria bacterium]